MHINDDELYVFGIFNRSSDLTYKQNYSLELDENNQITNFNPELTGGNVVNDNNIDLIDIEYNASNFSEVYFDNKYTYFASNATSINNINSNYLTILPKLE